MNDVLPSQWRHTRGRANRVKRGRSMQAKDNAVLYGAGRKPERKLLIADRAGASFEPVERCMRAMSRYAVPGSHRRVKGRRRQAMISVVVDNEM